MGAPSGDACYEQALISASGDLQMSHDESMSRPDFCDRMQELIPTMDAAVW